MPRKIPLSVTVITFNEERNIRRCLESVSWATEIIVVDSGSTDRTVEIAGQYGAKIFEEPWRGYVAAKNSAVEKAANEWVLSLDADEWLTPAGAGEIRKVLQSPAADAYAFNRLSSFCGRFMRSTWSPDRVVRMFRRDIGRFDGGKVHESLRLQPGSEVADLDEPLPHLSYRSLADYIDRLNRYTGLAAESKVEKGRIRVLPYLVLSPLMDFLKTYLLKQGFRDGMRGFLVAVGSGFYTFLKYAKVWELRRDTDPEVQALAGRTEEDPDPAGS